MGKVLIIEDMIPMQNLIKRQIEKKGHQALVANNAKDGGWLLKTVDDIDLILLDIMMPEMTGKEFLRKYFPLCMEKNVMVCMLTALSDTSDITECVNLGAFDYIIKPVDNELFSDKLDALIDNDTSKKFATIKADYSIKATIQTNSEVSEVLGKMFFLSENRTMVSFEHEFMEGDVFTLSSEPLMSMFEKEFELITKVLLKKKEGSLFYYLLDFIGLPEKSVKQIRNVTVLGKDIGEEQSDNEDLEKSAN